MKLMRITGQSEKDLRRFYDVSQWSGHWREPISAMLDLVVYLEEAVDFPPQWVLTSHENLVFVGQDDYRRGSLASIHPLMKGHGGPAKARYEVTRLAEAPWSHAVGYAEDVEQAWQMIRNVLPEPLALA